MDIRLVLWIKIHFLEFSLKMINHLKIWLTSARSKHFFFKIILPSLATNTNISKLVNVNDVNVKTQSNFRSCGQEKCPLDPFKNIFIFT